jgi:catechol 2,3-dioxygenase-like lactoylglutathione lyase family enzyme
MLIGAHSIVYSKDPDADRAFLRDVLGLPNVDVGEGWLIFGLPPAEVAVHPSEENDVHEFFFMCADVNAFVARMGEHAISCAPVQDRGYGLVTEIVLPGGGKLGVYEPRHARPESMAIRATGGRGAARNGAKSKPAAAKRAGRNAKPAKAKAKAKAKTSNTKAMKKKAGRR